MNLAVCIPVSWDFVPTPFVISLSQLFRPAQLKALRRLGLERYFYLFNRAFPLDLNRNMLVSKALELEADWLLFLHADMTFPADLVSRLLTAAQRSGSALLSACYFKKTPPHLCISALRLHPQNPQLLTPLDPLAAAGDAAESGEESVLVECDVIGMGAALIHREVFEAIAPPWFEYEVYAPTGERTVSEDVAFCRKAQAAGFTLVTDAALWCGHIRQVEVEVEDFRRWREAVKDRLAVGRRLEES